MDAPFTHRTERSAALGGGLAQVAVVIPAWKPDGRLRELVDSLRGLGFTQILVVDDGSGPAYEAVFRELNRMHGVEVRRHGKNYGKGAALKTAFSHLLAHAPELHGVVTADADGQHRPEDILQVAQALLAQGSPVREGSRESMRLPVLGTRRFDVSVPWRSRLGNRLTSKLFAVLTGCRLADTQTGLRALPMAWLPALLQLPGDRYEYEVTMLVELCRGAGEPQQVPIATVYLEGNRGSHFRPLRDSLRVIAALLRTCRFPALQRPTQPHASAPPSHGDAAFHTA